MGKLLLGKEKSESGVAEAFSFGQAKFSAHMQRLWNRLFTQIKKKPLDGSQYTLLREAGGVPPGNLGSESASAGFPHLS